MIPRRLFWLSDFLVFLLAFSLAYRVTPRLMPLVAPGGSLGWALDWMVRPPWAGPLLPPQEYVWMLISAALPSMVVLGALGAHQSLLEQSRTRIVLSGLLSPLVGLSMITLAL